MWFTKPFAVEVREQSLPMPAAGELLVKTLSSAISAGTEMLVYRGQIPGAMTLDASLDSLQSTANYPLQYGYASVGVVQQIGEGVDPEWTGKRVFSFQPHASHFLATPASVIVLPDDIEPEAAVFLANMETAVNLVQDGAPAIGERVAVLGQGVVGLLLTGLLSRFPLADLMAVDGIAARRAQALRAGARQAFAPEVVVESVAKSPQQESAFCSDADLIYEVSGVPEALNLAISLSGYSSRIVIGSWYGSKSTVVPLGGEAHRNRLHISTSQVSTIAPSLSGRWDKARRFELAWEMIRQTRPQQLITHRAPLHEADVLYRLLHEAPGDVLQAIFRF
ncbi:MAG: zinc-binding alcohol dehydrogenase [Gammaproteobacteria bacterium]|nr:zinc-binding alcohol dehydrogenase [Gammaproteobacteria bacterium]